MNNYVRYILHLEEPVKMGRQGNQSSTESLTYIAGSTLRGAFISRFISAYLSDVQTDLSSNDDTRKLLFTDTYFTDAYPCINGNTYSRTLLSYSNVVYESTTESEDFDAMDFFLIATKSVLNIYLGKAHICFLMPSTRSHELLCELETI